MMVYLHLSLHGKNGINNCSLIDFDKNLEYYSMDSGKIGDNMTRMDPHVVSLISSNIRMDDSYRTGLYYIRLHDEVIINKILRMSYLDIKGKGIREVIYMIGLEEELI